MLSVIIVSKDRPLQLKAYLESLIFFSGILPEKINVLYTKQQAVYLIIN